MSTQGVSEYKSTRLDHDYTDSYLLLYESLVLGGVRLRLRPGGGQGRHEVRVGGQLGGILGELQPGPRLPPLQQEVCQLTPLVVEDRQEDYQEDDDNEDNYDHSFGTR